jgi:hypothetical protein
MKKALGPIIGVLWFAAELAALGGSIGFNAGLRSQLILGRACGFSFVLPL